MKIYMNFLLTHSHTHLGPRRVNRVTDDTGHSLLSVMG